MAELSDEAYGCMECVTHHDPTLRRHDLSGRTIEALASTMTVEARKDATICDLGKFEGESLSTYHAYHIMLDGFADDDDGQSWRVGNVIAREHDDGFVIGHAYATEALAIADWS